MTLNKTFLLLLIAAIGLTIYMALVPQPPATPIDRFGDKFSHMAAFATLAILSRLSFPRAPALRLLERLSFFGALIEVFQNIPSLHRDCDWRDWVADSIAIAVALLLCEGVRYIWRSNKVPNAL